MPEPLASRGTDAKELPSMRALRLSSLRRQPSSLRKRCSFSFLPAAFALVGPVRSRVAERSVARKRLGLFRRAARAAGAASLTAGYPGEAVGAMRWRLIGCSDVVSVGLAARSTQVDILRRPRGTLTPLLRTRAMQEPVAGMSLDDEHPHPLRPAPRVLAPPAAGPRFATPSPTCPRARLSNSRAARTLRRVRLQPRTKNPGAPSSLGFRCMAWAVTYFRLRDCTLSSA
jgi:hypothetical protein